LKLFTKARIKQNSEEMIGNERAIKTA